MTAPADTTAPSGASGPAAATEELLAALARRGGDAEVFVRRGRSRRLERTEGADGALLVASSFEEGWAVRAGDRRGSFFMAGTGRPPGEGPWPAAHAPALRLPAPAPAPAWAPPPDLEQALLGESEIRGLIEAIDRALGKELEGARLRHAVLEEGTSESEILSTLGAKARWRGRTATLAVTADIPAHGPALAVRLEFADRVAQRIAPQMVARRLADRLHVAREGRAPERDRGEFLLAPAVAARLLGALAPFVVGPRAPARIETLRDRRGRVTAETVSLLDSGRLPQGLLAAPVDGEGVATREVVLVEEGLFRQPLLAWWQARPPFGRFSGCSRRDSYRDVPQPGPTHLFIKPRPDTSVAMLLGGVGRGYYLLDALGGVRIEAGGERFRVPVCGFAVQAGRAVHPVSRAWLAGSVSTLLHNVQGVGRDLLFQAQDGMIGSPSLLVSGLELLPARDPGD